MRDGLRYRIGAVAIAASALLGTLTAATEAQAEWKPNHARSVVGGEIYVWSSEVFGTQAPVVGFLQAEVADGVYLGARLPIAMSFNGPGDVSRFGLGNPTLSLHYASVGRELTWFLGGRLSIPLGLVDDDDWRGASALSALSMALYDAYLWVPDYLPLGAYGGVELRPFDPLYLRFMGDLGFLVPLGGRRAFGLVPGGDEPELFLQTKFEAEFRGTLGVGGGLALQTVWVPSRRGDNLQMALSPFFAYDTEDTFFMRAGLLLALDTPLGFGFDQNKVATVFAQLGAHLD